MHLRGNTEGYMNAASKHKKLRIHTGTHFHPFHSEEGRTDQLRWFDHWLKGIDTGILDEPPVKLEIRTGGSPERYAFRFENEWPLARTQWTKVYLKIEREPSSEAMAAEGVLTCEPPQEEAKLTYPASGSTKAGIASGSSLATTHGNTGRTGVSFESAPMPHDTEVTGPLVLNLWVSSTSGRHGHLRDDPQHRPRRQRRVRSRPARPAGAVRHQRLAARVAPQARQAKIAAVSARITRTTSAGG